MKIFLDDIRNPPNDSWIVCRTTSGVFDFDFAEVEIISLDHDLGENQPTGYDLCKRFEEMAFNGATVPAKIVIHSANPVGRKNMEAAIRSIERFRNA